MPQPRELTPVHIQGGQLALRACSYHGTDRGILHQIQHGRTAGSVEQSRYRSAEQKGCTPLQAIRQNSITSTSTTFSTCCRPSTTATTTPGARHRQERGCLAHCGEWDRREGAWWGCGFFLGGGGGGAPPPRCWVLKYTGKNIF
jgi:hypothetical protein